MENLISIIYSISALYFFYHGLQCYDYMEKMKDKSKYLKNTYKQTLLVIDELKKYEIMNPDFEDVFKVEYIKRIGMFFFYFQKVEYMNFQETDIYHPHTIQLLTEEYIVLLRIIDYMNRKLPISDVNLLKLKEKINDHFIFHQRYLKDYHEEIPCFYIRSFGVWNILVGFVISVTCTILILF